MERGKIKKKDKEKKKKVIAFWKKPGAINDFRHWYLGLASFTRSIFRVAVAWQTVLVLTSILGTLYVLAAFYTGRGEFVVKLDEPMSEAGFVLSETKAFEEPVVLLRNEALEDVTNITLEDIPDDVMDIDGKHNGENYLAYTFYVKNIGAAARNYRYSVTLQSSSKNAEEAVWFMIFINDKQKLYAKAGKDGRVERLYREWDMNFLDYAKEPEHQQEEVSGETEIFITDEVRAYHGFESMLGLKQINTIPWESKKLICSETMWALGANEMDKYTVVAWLEGDDPECVDDILGGHIEVSMKFTLLGENSDKNSSEENKKQEEDKKLKEDKKVKEDKSK